MIFYVKRMRERGRPIEPKQLRSIEAVHVDIGIHHESCVLGRASVVARVRESLPLDAPVIPELLEVQLHSMVPNGMVLTGIEVIDGVAYAQSWLCRSEK